MRKRFGAARRAAADQAAREPAGAAGRGDGGRGADDPDLHRAIDWLVKTQLTIEQAADPEQNPDGDPAGSWCEPWFTGTGFPRVFYLRYHLYRLYFPVMALGRFLSVQQPGVKLPLSEFETKPAIEPAVV